MSPPPIPPDRAALTASGNAALETLRARARALSNPAGGDLEAAKHAWEAVLARRPEDIEALGNLGLIASGQGRLEEAVAIWKQAIAISPKNAGLHGNLADVYRLMFWGEKAERAAREALRLAPGKSDLRLALANILWERRKIDEALRLAQPIGEGGIVGASTANLLANIHSHLGKGPEARRYFARALKLRPEETLYQSNYLLSLLYDEALPPAEVFAEHCAFGQRHDRAERWQPAETDPTKVLRVAFLSADFRLHSVGYFLEPLLEAMDRKRFEVTLYSLVGQPDSITKLLASYVARFVPVSGMSAEQFKRRCGEDGIDLLIELSGHTAGNALPLLGARPAPVQLTWLGYPHSTGMRSIDGRLSDAVIDPMPASQPLCTERVWHIPEGSHVYRMPGKPLELTPLPLLRSGRPTFFCCNNSAKISETTLRLWARLLREVPTARLVLKNGGFTYPRRAEEVWQFFAELGVSRDRVEIRPLTESVRAHVEMYGEADIALDTFPYNGTTTTCEALWMGVPVVTLDGTSARARHSASLLRQVGLDDWVCADEDALVARVQAALADAEGLSRLRGELRERLEHSTLGHGVSFAGRFQATLRRIWAAHCAGWGASPEALAAAEALAASDESRGAAALAVARAQWLEQGGQPAVAIAEWWKVARTGHLPPAWIELARRVEGIQSPPENHALWCEASTLHPDRAEFWATRAEWARSVGKLDDAAHAYHRALELSPENPGVWMNLAGTLRGLHRPLAAEAAAREALRQKPDFAEAWNNLGGSLRDQARFDEAVEAYCKGLAAQPQDAIAHSNLVYLLNFVPGVSSEDLRGQHAVYDENQLSPLPERLAVAPRVRRGQGLRIGFLSSDLRQHSVGYFLQAAFPPLVEAGVEVVAFADVGRPDALSETLRSTCHDWNWVAGHSDEELVELLRGAELDVLLELNGHTAGNRLPALAAGVAPWQGSWLGYPTHPECRALDGCVTDRVIYPEDATSAPGLWRLPECCLPWAIPEEAPIDEVAPGDGPLTFGAFHNYPKLNERVWADWIRLLEAFPQSRLLVKCGQLAEDAHRERVMKNLDARGAPVGRIEFLPYTASRREHLALYRRVDLALDPSPYNGVTTTMEALSMGVPVLTIPGDTPASRHGASILATYAEGWGVCADLEEMLATVSPAAADPRRFRAARAGRRQAFAERVAAYRPRWAEDFIATLEAACASLS